VASAPERFRGILEISRAQVLARERLSDRLEAALREIESRYGHDSNLMSMVALLFPERSRG
jgi:hypothetical protein